jgi:hypothetical protein
MLPTFVLFNFPLKMNTIRPNLVHICTCYYFYVQVTGNKWTTDPHRGAGMEFEGYDNFHIEGQLQ